MSGVVGVLANVKSFVEQEAWTCGRRRTTYSERLEVRLEEHETWTLYYYCIHHKTSDTSASDIHLQYPSTLVLSTCQDHQKRKESTEFRISHGRAPKSTPSAICHFI